jgi:imidazolonepropionase-like amidohydrolase
LTSSLPYQYIQLSNIDNKYKANLIGKDTISLTVTERAGTYQFTWQSKSQPVSFQSMQLVFGANGNQNQANGLLFLGDGNTSAVQLKLEIKAALASAENKDSIQKITPVIRYPFTEFGRTKLPIQEEIIFKNASVWTNTNKGILQQTDVHIKAGKIIAVGFNLQSASARIIPAENLHLTNGIIDEHSHLAIYNGVNECTQAITAEVRIGDVIQPEDINIYRQLAGGVIGAQLLHGSCNPVGGQSALIKLRWGKSAEEMKIKGADGFIKFALGENVKQSSGGPGLRYPQTRMGVEQIYIDAFNRALVYEQELKKNPAYRRDLELETLLEIVRKKRFISCHSYVQSEINMLMHVANQYGFKVNTFTHILEGYKVADKMKAHGVAASTFADWWAYKYEVMDAIPYNGSILNDMGIVTAINSDDAEMGRRLNQEAAKMIKYGNLTEEAAWKMLTLNPAKILHLDHLTGSIEAGKDADLVLWNYNPLSIYAKPLYTFVDGACYFSLEEDLKMRQTNQQDRNRLIQKMIALKKQGFKTQKQISKQDENYHCEDEN